MISNTVKYIGRHLILDLYGVHRSTLTSEEFLSEVLEDACKAAGATVLHNYFHKFGNGEGITGVIVLAESHCSIHTWPEFEYASIDIYMCGSCNPKVAARHILNDIYCSRFSENLMYRGTEI